MRVLLLNGSSGISGDMLVGALCDLGVPPSTFEWELGKLGDAAGDFHLHFERGRRGDVEGVKFTVHTGAVHTHDQDGPPPDGGQEETHAHDEHEHEHDPCGCGHEHDHGDGDGHHHPHHAHGDEGGEGELRSYVDLRSVIENAPDLSAFVQSHAAGALARIVEAEAAVRGAFPEQVFFDAESALDTLADLVCVCVGVEALGVERVFVGQLTDGRSASPAAREILRAAGAPVPREIFEPHELITPTGAALAVELALATGGSLSEAPPARDLRIEKTGQGLGTHDPSHRANALQAVLSTLTTAAVP